MARVPGTRILRLGGAGDVDACGEVAAKEAFVTTLRQCLHRLSAGTSGRVYDFELAEEACALSLVRRARCRNTSAGGSASPWCAHPNRAGGYSEWQR